VRYFLNDLPPPSDWPLDTQTMLCEKKHTSKYVIVVDKLYIEWYEIALNTTIKKTG